MHSWLLYSPAFLMMAVFIVMWWFGKLPTIATIHGLAEIANTKGGIILLLYAMSFVFFYSGMRYSYWVMSKSQDGKLTTENALIMATFAFVTGSAFGGAFSAMLKTMTGDSTVTTLPTQTTTSTVSTTVQKGEPDAKPNQ